MPKEKVIVPPSLEGSRPCWMGLGATWSIERCPCPGEGAKQDGFEGPFQLKPVSDSEML